MHQEKARKKELKTLNEMSENFCTEQVYFLNYEE